MIRTIKRLSGAAALCAAALTIPAAAAVADSGPITIEISNNAALQLDGSAALTITYSCLPGYGSGLAGGIWADMEQTQGMGTVSAPAICDDRDHTTTLVIAPGPFLPFDAAASVTVGNGFNEGFTQQAEVTIQSPAGGKAGAQKAAAARDVLAASKCAKPTSHKPKGHTNPKVCHSAPKKAAGK